MSYSLDTFVADCKATLVADPGLDGREKVRQLLQRVLADEAFMAAHFGSEADSERNVLYEDPDLDFCIVAHVYQKIYGGRPHDHGPVWAIYGQAAGVTEMTDWRLVEPPKDGRAGKVASVRTYTLKPDDTKIYNEGDIHSPSFEGETRLVRVEGQNMTTVTRDPLEPES